MVGRHSFNENDSIVSIWELVLGGEGLAWKQYPRNRIIVTSSGTGRMTIERDQRQDIC